MNGNPTRGVTSDIARWSAENKAFLDSIRNDPHPLRTVKIHKKRLGEFLPLPTTRTGHSGEFLSYRTNILTLGMLGVAELDLMFMLSDNPRVFTIAEGLGNLLRQTDIKGADLNMLRLPFRTIFIQFPPNDIPVIYKYNDVALLDGVYMTEEEQSNGTRLILMLAVGIKDGASIADDNLFTFPVFFAPNTPLDDQIKTRIDDLTHRKSGPELENLKRFHEIFNWALNSLLYITSSGADLREEWLNKSAAQKMKKAKGSKKAKIRDMLEVSSIRITRVGGSLPTGPTTLGGHASPKLHWVRGFWRHQACGVGWTERKHKWIKPYLRGEGREIVTKMYDVR